jgi:hypothetical protein
MRKKRKSRKRHYKHKPKKRQRKRHHRGKKHSFPKNPKKGDRKTISVRGRKVTFQATGKKGFGAWRIVSSTK